MATTDGVPSPPLYAYRSAAGGKPSARGGYVNSDRDFDYLDPRRQSDAELRQEASKLAPRIRVFGAAAVWDGDA